MQLTKRAFLLSGAALAVKAVSVAENHLGTNRLSFGQRSGFIGKQNIHTAGGFNTHQLSHQHISFQHFFHIGA